MKIHDYLNESVPGKKTWNDIYNNEQELLDDMMQTWSNINKVPYKVSYNALVRGYEYIESFKRYYLKNGKLTDKQMTQLKRMASEIYKNVHETQPTWNAWKQRDMSNNTKLKETKTIKEEPIKDLINDVITLSFNGGEKHSCENVLRQIIFSIPDNGLEKFRDVILTNLPELSNEDYYNKFKNRAIKGRKNRDMWI